ncbi:MAG: YwaF family protein [Christensenellaceae bacterium]|nr:YwaF family protein [Christensenellaceae bacterium]
MQWFVLTVMSAPVIALMRHVRRLRGTGQTRRATTLYKRAAWALGLTVYGAMAVQEGVLLAAGMLTWQTGLPLHLCSMMGVLTLPMLVTERRFLWHLSVYLGLPGAALALIFPAVLPTPWPLTTELSFFALHAGLVLAPILPLCLGRRPSPRGALAAGGFLLTVGLAVMALNDRLGSNYLFVSWAIPGTPLGWLARWGMTGYRLALAGLCALALTAEAAGVRLAEKSAHPKK